MGFILLLYLLVASMTDVNEVMKLSQGKYPEGEVLCLYVMLLMDDIPNTHLGRKKPIISNGMNYSLSSG